jgi:disease resistance protein
VRIEYGAPPETTTALILPPTGGLEEKTADGTAHAGALLQCRNYGCMKKYLEAENNEGACQHHTAPPLFREGKKQWSCCPHLSGWDWDEFMAIPGCVHTAHSTVTPGATFAVSPTIAAAEASATTAPVKSIAQFNADNPTAPSSLTSLAKSMAPDAPKKLVIRADGKKQCVHFGCQQFFSDEENTGEACRHHRLPPVFHEGMKYWGCCSGTKHIDFDDFLAHPGMIEC